MTAAAIRASSSAVPAHVAPDLVMHFDIRTDQAFQGDPQAGLLALETPGPLFFTPLNGGHWVAADGIAATEIFQKTDIFSADTPLDGSTESGRVIPMGIDPPEHRKYRRLIDAILTPRSAEAMDAEIRALAIELIETVRARGHCEFLSEVAEPYPVIIFLRLAGLPVERLGEFRKWAKQMLHAADPAERQEAAMAVAGYLMQEMQERAARPGDDLLSALLPGRVDDRPLAPEELLSMVMVIFSGGLDTVLNTLTFIMHFLANNPEHRQRLVADPARIPRALEEMMRRFCMVSLFRKVVCDTDFHGATLKAGDRVWASTVMIGMDERFAACPAEVDFDRANIRNPIFGVGPHHCPGRHLARQELRIFLEEWLARIPDFAIDSSEPIPVLTGPSMGMAKLPLRWPAN